MDSVFYVAISLRWKWLIFLWYPVDLYMRLCWQVEELYTEVLHQIVHNVGCDVVTKTDQEEVCALLKEAFKMDPEKHQQLLEIAQGREVSVF